MNDLCHFCNKLLLNFSEKAMLMFKKWQELEGDAANKDELIYVLERLKMNEVLEGVFT